MRRRATWAAMALPLSLVAGCAASGAQEQSSLTVSAAASLTEAFTSLGEQFEADRPGTTVRFNFGGSSSLAEQVVSGAPVDVLATASLSTMDTVIGSGQAVGATTFATNTITIAVPRGNPAAIASIADLARDGVRVAQCAPEVPCGAAAEKTLTAAGIGVTPVTLDPDVKTVLGRVASGEVDAGLVYRTDVATAEVEEVEIPAEVAATTDYAITVVTDSGAPDLAAEFVDLLLGPAGQEELAAAGFGAP